VSEKFEKTFDITKIDTEERNVFGIFSMMEKNGEPLIDLDGETIASSEIEKAAYQFNLYARTAGENHRKIGVGRLIESFVVTKKKMETLSEMLVKVGVTGAVMQPNAEFWFGGFHIDDDSTWDLIKTGEYQSFSIGGVANKE